VQIRKLFHKIGQNLAISDTSNVDFPKPDQHVTSFSRATLYTRKNHDLTQRIVLALVQTPMFASVPSSKRGITSAR